MQAPTALRPGSMDTLVDAIAGYDGAGGSIGYSVYSYVGGMYDADGGVKILKVNEVAAPLRLRMEATPVPAIIMLSFVRMNRKILPPGCL